MAKIMIIDDDVELADNMSLLLKKKGHAVGALSSVDGAIEHLVADKPEVLLLDVMFPDNPAAGFDLARQIRRTAAIRDLPIVLLTSLNQQFPMDFTASDLDPEWLPVQAFVDKSSDLNGVLKRIEQMI